MHKGGAAGVGTGIGGGGGGMDNTWGRTGEALGAGAKIYGYRVDNVHMETYRILGGLHRHGLANGEEFEIEIIMPKEDQDNENEN